MISTVLKSKKPVFGAFCLISVLISGSAHALTVESSGAGWLNTIGGAAISTPNFPGSDKYTFIAVPSVSLSTPGLADRLIAPDNALSLQLFSPDPSFSLGVVNRFNPVGNFSGLGGSDNNWSVQSGIYFEMWPQADNFRIRGELRQASDGLSGLIGTLGADFVERIGKFTISAGPRMTLSEAGSTERDPGIASLAGGYNNRSLGAAGIVRFAASGAWTTSVYANYDRVMTGQSGEAAPKTGMFADQVTIGASFNMTFPTAR
jgi:outer membrane protein